MSKDLSKCLNLLNDIDELCGPLRASNKVLNDLISKLDIVRSIMASNNDVNDDFRSKVEYELTRIFVYMDDKKTKSSSLDSFEGLLRDQEGTKSLEIFKEFVNYLLTAALSLNNNSEDSIDSPVVEEIRKSFNFLKMMSNDSLNLVESNKNTFSVDIVRLQTASTMQTDSIAELQEEAKLSSEKGGKHASVQILSDAQLTHDVSMDDAPANNRTSDPVGVTVASFDDESGPIAQIVSGSVLDKNPIQNTVSETKPLPSVPAKSTPSSNFVQITAETVMESKLSKQLSSKVDDKGSITSYNFSELIESIDINILLKEKDFGAQLLENAKNRKYVLNDVFYQQLYVYIKPLDMDIKKQSALHLICTQSVNTEALMIYAPLCEGKESLSFYTKAAENGNVTAMHAVADIYFNGKGVAKSIRKAEKWYKKAVINGDQKSAVFLHEIVKRKRKRMTCIGFLSVIMLMIIAAICLYFFNIITLV